MAIAIPIAGAMVVLLVDVGLRRDIALLAAVAVVLFAAWLGGIWSGLVAASLMLFLLTVPLAPQFAPPLDAWSLFLFAAAALTAVAVVESMYRSRWRAEAARDRARTSRRAEHAIRAELESVVSAIGDGLVVADADGTISLMNQAAIDIVGRRTETIADLVDHFAPNENGTANAGELLTREGPTSEEYSLIDRDRLVEVATFPMTGDEPGQRVVVLRDVTEARRQEMLREAFLSLLSHELRTPMTAVYGGATLLQRVGDSLDANTRNELRKDIVTEADRLSRLIDDLLVLTRVEQGVEVGQEPALLQHIVAEVVERDRRGLVSTSILVAAEAGLPPVKGDETSIRQVTHNLLSNAVKYSPIGSEIEVRVEPGEGEVLVRVLDRGAGLTVEEAPHVFEMFYRGTTPKSTAPGIGIGLFVSQRLVEAMGGRIWTSAREGGGSEFGFALPEWPLEAEGDEEVSADAEPVARVPAATVAETRR
jgi:K+-sensing histidine kinase KdpD